MRRGLFMADEDVADTPVLKQRVVNRQHRAAGIAENRIHALVNQAWIRIAAPLCSPTMSSG